MKIDRKREIERYEERESKGSEYVCVRTSVCVVCERDSPPLTCIMHFD